MSSELQVRRLKLRELRVLLAAVQAGSMAKAAKQLAISQPAVSRAIDDLEKTLGVPLFDRTARGNRADSVRPRATKARHCRFRRAQAGCPGDRAPLQSRDR